MEQAEIHSNQSFRSVVQTRRTCVPGFFYFFLFFFFIIFFSHKSTLYAREEVPAHASEGFMNATSCHHNSQNTAHFTASIHSSAGHDLSASTIQMMGSAERSTCAGSGRPLGRAALEVPPGDHNKGRKKQSCLLPTLLFGEV